MSKYNHLSLRSPDKRDFYTRGGPEKMSGNTENNQSRNRFNHSARLKSKIEGIISGSSNASGDIPLYLEIDPEKHDLDFLRSSFKFEIISEQENGKILIISHDPTFSEFLKKISALGENIGIGRGGKNVGLVHDILSEEERIKSIISGLGIGSIGEIENDKIFNVVLCIAVGTTSKMPESGETNNLESKLIKYNDEIEEVRFKRQNEIEELVNNNHGNINSFIDDKFMNFYDCILCSVQIDGQGLKDILKNFPYIFNIEPNTIIENDNECYVNDTNFSIIDSNNVQQPDENAPRVVIIDSGIDEGHPYLVDSIEKSKCYIKGKEEDDVADEYMDGGHGTRVASAILYGNNVPLDGEYKLPCFLRNARILDGNLCCNIEPFMEYKKIVEDFYDNNSDIKPKIFNSCINQDLRIHPGIDYNYMDNWSATLDELMYNRDIIFIQSIGNISKKIISEGQYPNYLFSDLNKLIAPAHSRSSLVVGSISNKTFEDDEKKSIANDGQISSFSRIGPGWGSTIKPELVSYGGDYLKNKYSNELTLGENIAPLLFRKAPPIIGCDNVGTSFSTPKITNLIVQIQKRYPELSTLLYKALLVSSGNQTNTTWTKDKNLMAVGYGLPNLDDALYSSDYRVTLYSPVTEKIKGGEIHIFEIPIPESIRNGAYKVKIDITMVYKAKPRKTRRDPRQYFSTWVDRKTSKMGESKDSFYNRYVKSLHGNGEIGDQTGFSRNIGTTSQGNGTSFSRSRSTSQRDWTVIDSDNLNDSFCIGVIGHKGWDRAGQFPAEYALVVNFTILNEEIPIYSLIQTEIESEVESEIEITTEL